jgi:uncharacterized protein GlcG (DUF336 family)
VEPEVNTSTAPVSASVSLRSVDWCAPPVCLSAAVQAAPNIGACVNVAVVDASGLLAGFLRMPGAPLHSVDIAIDKAYTAVSFGLPTHQWADALQSHSAAVREGIVLRPRFVAFGGGLPMIEAGQRIGAIGVSGGSETQDQAIAQAGLDALGLTQA